MVVLVPDWQECYCCVLYYVGGVMCEIPHKYSFLFSFPIFL